LWSVVLAAPLVGFVGCGPAEPEQTEDPAEVEKLRQEHLDQADRERQETR
jgi:hypothetical protein